MKDLRLALVSLMNFLTTPPIDKAVGGGEGVEVGNGGGVASCEGMASCDGIR